LGYYPYAAAGEVIISAAGGAPIAAVKTCGKGRVVAFGYLPAAFLPNVRAEVAAEGGCFGSVNLADIPPEKNVAYDTTEHFYALIGKAMLWAAGKDRAVITSAAYDGDAGVFKVDVSEPVVVEYRVVNKYDEVVASGTAADGVIHIPREAVGDLRVETTAVADGMTLDWRTDALRRETRAEIKLSCETEPVRCGGIFRAWASFTGELLLEHGAGWVASVVDDFENVLYTVSGVGEGERLIEYEVGKLNSLNIRLQAKIISPHGFTALKKETPRVVAVPRKRGIDDFEAFLSPTCRGTSGHMNFIGELMRGIGVTGLFPGSARNVAPSGAEGMGVYWYKRAQYIEQKENYLLTGDKKYLIRRPCLSDPGFWRETEKNIARVVTRSRAYAPVSYFANDEGSLTCYGDEYDFCFCEYCMAGMRDWLKEQYEDLGALNAKWKTDYADWDAVTPDTFDEAHSRGHFRSWGDHRLYMELVFAGAYEKMIAAVREHDPEGVLRMSGCQASSPYTGCDYYELHKHVGYFEAYGGGNQLEFHRSFMRPGTIFGGWTGYGVSGAAARRQIWYRTLHGLTLHSIFWFLSNLNPDYTYPKTALDLSEPLIELKREGIGKLLLHASVRDPLGVAVHYSMRSVHASYARGNEKKFTANREGWVNLLEDCGYQYDFIATQQIEAGGLGAYRALILPYSVELSDKEADAIKKFAEEGGTVVADFQTGVADLCDGGAGPLDSIFGIERRNAYCREFYTCSEMMRDTRFDLFDAPVTLDGLSFAEEGIRKAAGGSCRAAYYQDFSPALVGVVVNGYGSGRGIYLNASPDAYPELRKDGGEDARTLLRAVLGYAGIKKYCELIDPKTGGPAGAGYETVYYRSGGARYVAVLRDLNESRATSHDGLVVGASEDHASADETIRIEFLKPAHIYDVRERSYLGFTDRIETGLAPGGAAVFSVLPHKISRVAVDLQEKVEAGGTLAMDISAETESGAAAGPSVYAINIYSPSGRREWEFCENVPSDGAAVYQKFIPYNAAKGRWRANVKEAATGVTAVKEFEVI